MNRIHYCYLLTRALPEGGCRYYIGIRTAPPGLTPAEDVTYMGSGDAIEPAVKKHRAEFSKHIVETFETRAEAAHLERALVGLATANSPWSYNLQTGGEDGGLRSEETKAKMRAAQRLRFEDPAEVEKNRAMRHLYFANETADQEAARSRAISAGNRRRFSDPAEREKTGAGNRRRCAGMSPDERRVMTAKAREASHCPKRCSKISAGNRNWYATATADQKAARIAAQQEGKRRAKRVRNEVAQIFAALIVNHYHGGAEAA